MHTPLAHGGLPRRAFLSSLALGLAGGRAAAQSAAADYPKAQPVKIILPFAAGSAQRHHGPLSGR